jgi:parallel beta-helix repeat protein
MDSSYSVSIEDSKIEYNSYGIVAEPLSGSNSRALASSTATAARTSITNVLVSGNGYGMSLNGAEFSITDAQVTKNLGDGIAVLAADEVHIVSSQAKENNGYGMLLNSKLITVMNGTASRNGRSGVAVLEADEVHMEELELEGNGFGVFPYHVATRDGMFLHGKSITVNNVFTAYNSGSGIDVLNADDLQLNGVTAFQNIGNGLYLLSGKLINIMNSDLSSNILQNQLGAGLYVGHNADTLYLENVTASNMTGLYPFGMILEGVESIYAKNLVISNNAELGISGPFIQKYALFQNVTANGNKLGIYVDVGGDLDIEGLTANDNTEDGLWVYTSGNISIENAITSNNAESGLSLNRHGENIFIENATANNNLGPGLFINIFDRVNVTFAGDIIASGNSGNGIEIHGSSSDWENPVKGQVTVEGDVTTDDNELVGFLLNQTNAHVNVTLSTDDDATLEACGNNGFDIQNDNENNGTGTFLPESLVGYTCDNEITCANACLDPAEIFERHLKSPAVSPNTNAIYATELTSTEYSKQAELERQKVFAEEVYQKKMQMLEELRAELANLIEVSTKL